MDNLGIIIIYELAIDIELLPFGSFLLPFPSEASRLA